MGQTGIFKTSLCCKGSAPMNGLVHLWVISYLETGIKVTLSPFLVDVLDCSYDVLWHLITLQSLQQQEKTSASIVSQHWPTQPSGTWAGKAFIPYVVFRYNNRKLRQIIIDLDWPPELSSQWTQNEPLRVKPGLFVYKISGHLEERLLPIP